MNLARRGRKIISCFIGSEKEKYDSREQVLSWLASQWSFRVYHKSLLWFHDKEYLEVWRQFPESDGYVHERKFNLYYFAKAARMVEGDTAECGVYKGVTSYLILRAIEGKNDDHHVFDSFEGLSDPGQFDIVEHDRTERWKQYASAMPEEVVRRNLSEFKNVHYYKGWIPERFGEIRDRRFSFVHIDVDLYQPTMESIAFFYERTNPGGIIICDDYGFESCPGAYEAMNTFMEDKPESIVHLTTGQGVIIKR